VLVAAAWQLHALRCESRTRADTPLVDFDDEGDAHFSGSVSMPIVCATEPDIAFLIRTASGRWIGNGTVLR
jgi:hypothetical protein